MGAARQQLQVAQALLMQSLGDGHSLADLELTSRDLELLEQVGVPKDDVMALLHCINDDELPGNGSITYQDIADANSTIAPLLRQTTITAGVKKNTEFRSKLASLGGSTRSALGLSESNGPAQQVAARSAQV